MMHIGKKSVLLIHHHLQIQNTDTLRFGRAVTIWKNLNGVLSFLMTSDVCFQTSGGEVSDDLVYRDTICTCHRLNDVPQIRVVYKEVFLLLNTSMRGRFYCFPQQTAYSSKTLPSKDGPSSHQVKVKARLPINFAHSF